MSSKNCDLGILMGLVLPVVKSGDIGRRSEAAVVLIKKYARLGAFPFLANIGNLFGRKTDVNNRELRQFKYVAQHKIFVAFSGFFPLTTLLLLKRVID
ncbi:hypothetical protein TNIN_65681 [Trichonephila inaurata madagascariensis]|uniref:Uncharacterized protein n=1 Tax=Trichonephila inaurata madagascariensis TaxID=2747483 RepID=A0A8X7CFB0_9ARAC|nr:hypothetical protein TNIN_65681 [Trichonephila inaurata madagascariensis]